MPRRNAEVLTNVIITNKRGQRRLTNMATTMADVMPIVTNSDTRGIIQECTAHTGVVAITHRHQGLTRLQAYR